MLPSIRSYLLSQVGWIPDRELHRLQAALALTGGECARHYGRAPPVLALVSSAKEIPDDGAVIVLASQISVPGDLAYHEALEGRPHSVVLAGKGTSLGEVQERTSHEHNEVQGDPFVDQFVELESGDFVPVENSDPLQGLSRMLDLGEGEPVVTALWVPPAWFGAGGTGTLAEDGRVVVGAGGEVRELEAAGHWCIPLTVEAKGYCMIVSSAGKIRYQGPGPLGEKLRYLGFRSARRLAAAHQLALRLRFRRSGGRETVPE